MVGKVIDGQGIYYYNSQDIYFGDFVNGEFHGYGTYIFAVKLIKYLKKI
jgi:hypothetical protein